MLLSLGITCILPLSHSNPQSLHLASRNTLRPLLKPKLDSRDSQGSQFESPDLSSTAIKSLVAKETRPGLPRPCKLTPQVNHAVNCNPLFLAVQSILAERCSLDHGTE